MRYRHYVTVDILGCFLMGTSSKYSRNFQMGTLRMCSVGVTKWNGMEWFYIWYSSLCLVGLMKWNRLVPQKWIFCRDVELPSSTNSVERRGSGFFPHKKTPWPHATRLDPPETLSSHLFPPSLLSVSRPWQRSTPWWRQASGGGGRQRAEAASNGGGGGESGATTAAVAAPATTGRQQRQRPQAGSNDHRQAPRIENVSLHGERFFSSSYVYLW
jgi:hypothetical protein